MTRKRKGQCDVEAWTVEDLVNAIKEKYPETVVLSTIKYLNGEYTKDEEIIFKELHKGL